MRGNSALPKHTRLQRRKAGYYLRVRVPDDVRHVIGKREVVRALGTADHAAALTRVRLQAVEADKLFARARRAPSGGKIIPVAAAPITKGRRKPSAADIERALASWFPGQTTLERQVALTALDADARHEALIGLFAMTMTRPNTPHLNMPSLRPGFGCRVRPPRWPTASSLRDLHWTP